jgi:RNA polymerase sporulation-specific sigma factor
MISTLSEEENELVKLRYYEDKTQAQTGQQMGMTQVQVSRMEKKIMEKLRREI